MRSARGTGILLGACVRVCDCVYWEAPSKRRLGGFKCAAVVGMRCGHPLGMRVIVAGVGCAQGRLTQQRHEAVEHRHARQQAKGLDGKAHHREGERREQPVGTSRPC